MNKETIAFGITLIFLALIVIIRTIYLVKTTRKLERMVSIQTLFDLSDFMTDSADLINKANKKIIAFEKDNLNSDLSLIVDTFNLNSEAISSILNATNILLDTIDEYQKSY